MHKAYLLLGSNEGNREVWLERCIQMVQNHGTISSRSAIYETEAWGLEDQPDFLNMAICLDTHLSASELLKAVQSIEHALERQRTVKWGQRTLDIDILFYDTQIIDLSDLKVPHPYLPQRRFALTPLNDIASGLLHPVLNKTVGELLRICPDRLPARKL